MFFIYFIIRYIGSTDVTDEAAHQFKTIVREAGELSRRRSAIRRSEAAVVAAAATAARPASSKQQRRLENSLEVQSRESIDEKIAARFYANVISFATRRDGARRAGTRARTAVGRWAHTRPHARAVVGVGRSV